MDSLSEVSFEDFRAGLTPSQVRVVQLLQVAMGVSTMIFGLIVVSFEVGGFLERVPRSPSGLQIVQVLTLVHVVTALGVFVLGKRFYGSRFSPERLSAAVSKPFRDSRGEPIDAPADKCLAVIRSAIFIRLALLNAGATAGLATCFVAVILGVMGGHPGYWLNGITSVWFLIHVVVTLPTRDRLEGIFVEKIAGRGAAT